MSSTNSAPRSTIIEVARDAGVSKTSVSRYLSDERHRLSPTMQARIADSVERLGYRPNQMARGLKGGRSKLIGMLVADIRNPFSVDVLHGVEQACRARGFSLLVCNTDNDPAQERAHLALLASYRVEGLVINAAGGPSDELTTLAGQGTPVVLVDRSLGDFEADVVGLDNVHAIDMAIDHFATQGYRELLFISEPPQAASSRQVRLARFRQRVTQSGLTGEVLCQRIASRDSRLQQALSGFINGPSSLPRGILCANGNVTLAVAHALQAMDVRFGEVGLLGIDELDWCALAGTGITTLAQPTEAIGLSAVDSLMQRLTNPGSKIPPRHIFHAGHLIARGSTKRTESHAPHTT